MIRKWLWRFTPIQRFVQHRRALSLRKTHPEGVVPPLPLRVVVEPTNGCNLGCAYCGNKDMVRPVKFLPLDLFEKLLDEMVELGIPRVTLHTIGEPTLHPHIDEMIAMASARGRVVTMSTNGSRLTDDLARRLILARPTMLHISADAADKETLAKTRDKLDLDVVLSGIKTLRRIRDAEGHFADSPWGRVRMPTLAVTCVLTPHFTREVEKKFFETFTPLVDDIVFHTANNHGGYVDDAMYIPTLVPLPIKRAFYKRLRRPCPYPWDTLYLLSDLSVSVCRWDFDARITVGKYGESTLKELWHSERIRRLRRAHMNFDYAEWLNCENCSGNLYENRFEHWRLTEKLKKRNGMVSARNTWLSENPMNIAPGQLVASARS